jgi:hypothetical protein
MKKIVLILSVLCLFLFANASQTVQQNKMVEFTFSTSKVYKNPFFDVELYAVISAGNRQILRLPAFWKGGGEWAFRFSSPTVGKFTFTTECSDKSNNELHGQTGEINVIPYSGKNLLYKHGAVHVDKTTGKFAQTDGTPFLWLADSWWFGMSKRIGYNDFCFLVNDRVKKKFSVIQFAIGFACDIAPFDNRDQNEAGFIWQKDLSSINPEYFEYTDRRIQYMVEAGIMPNIVGSWAYYIHTLGTERFKKHWNYLIARYGAYPVCWTLCGEAGLTWYKTDKPKEQLEMQRREWSAVAEYIKQTDPFRRLLTVHSGPNSGGHQPIDRMELIDFFMTQPGHNDFETLPNALAHLQKAKQMYPEKPFMAGEVCFEGMAGACKEKIQRYLFWSHLLSGACGHAYGNDAMWQFNSRTDKFGPSVAGQIWGNSPWEEACQWPGATHVGIGKQILETIEWWKLEPHPEWISQHASVENFMDPFCAGIPGKLRIIYFPSKVAPWSPKMQVKALENGVGYVAKWVDPLSGEIYAIGNISGNEKGEWNIPFAPILQDWLLILEGK